MDVKNWHRPNWAMQVLWIRCKCPRCNSVQFKQAELRPFDKLLCFLPFHAVRCMFCWRRYYWVTFRAAPVG